MLLAIDTANEPAPKALRYANRLKTHYSGVFSTDRNQQFLITCSGISDSVAGHPALPCFVLPLNRPIRSRICQKVPSAQPLRPSAIPCTGSA